MRHLLLLAAMLLAPVGAPAMATTLPEMLAEVYATSPELAAARARLRAIDEEIGVARAERRPQVQAVTSQGISQLGRSGQPETAFATSNVIEIRQPILTGGAAGARLRQADAAVRAERARLRLVEAETLLEGVRAYAAIEFGRRRLAVTAANERRHRQELENTRQRFRFGDTTTTDIAQTEARLAQAIAAREMAEGEIEAAMLEYERLSGLPPGKLAALPACPLIPATLEAARELAQDHPALLAAEHELGRARAGVELAQAASGPRLALSGQAGYVDQQGTGVSSGPQASVAAIVTVPLYAGGGEHARIRQSKQTFAERRHGLEDVRRGIQRDVGTAWQARLTAGQRVATIATQLRAARIALEGVRQEARIGARAVVDILDAERDFVEAQLAEEQARRDDTLAGWTLAHAVGRLDAATLGLPVEPYDPEAYHGDAQRRWFGTGPSLRELAGEED